MFDFLVGLFELAFSLFLALLTTWFAFRRFSMLAKVELIWQNNISAAILLASTVFSAGFVVKQAAYPAVSSLQTMLYRGLTLLGALKTAGVALGSILLAVMLALVGIWTALQVFLRLTREIDELAEIERNNVAVAIVLGSVIVVIGLFLAQGVQGLLAAFIPMPAFERIRVMGSM